jgi:hypothetical protein
MLNMIGLLNSIVRESREMLYQNEFDYLFSSFTVDIERTT